MGTILATGAGYWLARTRPWRREPRVAEPVPALEPLDDVPVT